MVFINWLYRNWHREDGKEINLLGGVNSETC